MGSFIGAAGLLAVLSVSGVFAFLLTVVGIAILWVVIVTVFKAAKGQHTHAFSAAIAIVCACVFVALAASVATMTSAGTSILSLFGL